MLIKNLIKDTIWTPSKIYGSYQPKISVLLPTYSRAKSGLFKKAVYSILNQSFGDFELIIIDDASTDGTKQLIETFMQQDERIHCLTHSNNIGLPAVSEYEAFMKSSGEYIIFAFDDFIFEPNAFKALYEAVHGANCDVCHGLAKLYYLKNNVRHYLLFGEQSISKIHFTNTIANASIIVKKEVFYNIGLYDPHILLTRVCDWDLWIRISRVYSIKKINTLIGSEYGPMTKDSLGVLYHNNSAFIRDYMTRNRDEQLLPQNFHEVNIASTLPYLENGTNFYIQQLLHFYSAKTWYTPTNKSQSSDCQKIIFYATDSVNFHLCFSHLNSKNFVVQCLLATQTYYDAYLMISADIVIFNRILHPHLKLISLLRNLNIACYYFIDDNFTILAKESSEFHWYSKENLTKNLSNMDGVITSTKALKNFFLKEKIHTKVLCSPPALDSNLLFDNNIDSLIKHKLNIAIVGGQFRAEYIIKYLIPALNQFNKKHPLTLHIRKGLLTITDNIKFPFIEFDLHENYPQFVHFLRSSKIDVIIHPYGKTVNLPYKTNSILLTALYSNANIIVSEEPAFLGLSEEHGILKITNDITTIIHALICVSDSIQSKNLKEKLYEYCLKEFSPNKCIFAFNSIIKNKTNHITHVQRMNNLAYFLSDMLYNEENKEAAPLLALPLNSQESPIARTDYLSHYNKIKYTIKYVCRQRNLAQDLAPQFQPLMNDIINNKLISFPYNLKISSLLNNKPYIEYKLHPQVNAFSRIILACEGAPINTPTGLIGVEIVLPNGKIGAHVHQDIATIDFFAPIQFTFSKLRITKGEQILIRIFVKSTKTPIFTYELHEKKLFRARKSLFCTLA